MNTTRWGELEKTCRKEKDSGAIPRTLVARMICVCKMSMGDVAANFVRSERWVHAWLARFDAGGLDYPVFPMGTERGRLDDVFFAASYQARLNGFVERSTELDPIMTCTHS